MFKRIALALTFVAAFAAAGLCFNSTAEAWRYWGRPYASYHYGPPRAYYGYRAPYRAYYYGGPVVRRSYYYGSYYPAPYYYGPGVQVAVGF